VSRKVCFKRATLLYTLVFGVTDVIIYEWFNVCQRNAIDRLKYLLYYYYYYYCHEVISKSNNIIVPTWGLFIWKVCWMPINIYDNT